jgi:phage baseplate assembly protein gpV
MDLLNIIHREFDRLTSGRYNRRIGLVTSYDPKTYSAKHTIQPDGQETGWIPLPTSFIGNGFGILTGPNIGDQHELDFQEGDLEAGRVTGRVHSDKEKPPQVQSGEILHQTQWNHVLKMNNDGSLTITTSQKTVDGKTTNKQPGINASSTMGNMSFTSTQAKDDNGKQKGGQVQHTSSDGNKLKHTATLHPTNGITYSSTDGTNTHSITIHPTNGISHTSNVAVKINAPSGTFNIKNLNVQGFVNVLANSDGTGGVLNAARGLGAPVTNAILGVVPTS